MTKEEFVWQYVEQEGWPQTIAAMTRLLQAYDNLQRAEQTLDWYYAQRDSNSFG